MKTMDPGFEFMRAITVARDAFRELGDRLAQSAETAPTMLAAELYAMDRLLQLRALEATRRVVAVERDMKQAGKVERAEKREKAAASSSEPKKRGRPKKEKDAGLFDANGASSIVVPDGAAEADAS